MSRSGKWGFYDLYISKATRERRFNVQGTFGTESINVIVDGLNSPGFLRATVGFCWPLGEITIARLPDIRPRGGCSVAPRDLTPSTRGDVAVIYDPPFRVYLAKENASKGDTKGKSGEAGRRSHLIPDAISPFLLFFSPFPL